ncbi:coatomer protein [Ephemerocybe angulata]|uniref:Coatomer subunit beta' n=1 Tax=Ephemerocybe angulata TaxID=980116 RepID=A0A8H6HQR5_9AGAR|nr:coatomer protein [Tulosesus angulatus]
MLFEVTKKLFARSDRVKAVDFHPTEPWLLTALYNGSVNIYNHNTGALVRSFEVAEGPVRCAKFIPRKNWFVAGSDDYQLRVFNYNTHEKVAAFEAHPDYIRCLTVHPTLPIVLTGSDDMSIKAWDWEKGWKNIQTFEGHTHYIMSLSFNPKDGNTFISACLDRTCQDAHDKGVNYVDFYPGSDKPYLATCGDDKTVKIYDYLSKSCVQTMEGHTNNVSFAVWLDNLPVVISGSEDGTIKIWNSSTYRIENTLSYGLERAWCVALNKGANEVAVGFDEGVVVIKLGRDEPTFSMDPSGKLIYTKNHEVLSGNLATVEASASQADGARVSFSVFPTAILHSPNGRFVTVVGDGEYIIYTALAWRNKSFGSGISFAWAPDSNTYAVLESKVKLKIYKNFREKTGGAGSGATMKGSGSWAVEQLYTGPVLGARGNGFVVFWDWETGEIVRRVDVDAKSVYWSGTGNLVAIATDDSFYVLKFDRDAYTSRVEEGGEITDEGVEEAFDIVAEIPDGVKTGKWVGDCFIYTASNNRLCYFVGSESYTISPFDTPLYLLGYLPSHNRVYLADKDLHLYAYTLSLSVVEYQTAVLRGDMESAKEILESVPKSEVNKVARFLEGKDLKELALEITTDPDHKFDLALSLDDLDTAVTITRKLPPTESTLKWKAIGDRSLTVWRFDLAKEAFSAANDTSSLLLLYLAQGDKNGLGELADRAGKEGKWNLAFAARYSAGDVAECVGMLGKTGRAAEGALFARTYAPSLVSGAVKTWKEELKSRPKIAAAIADPEECPELFEEGWADALAHEKEVREGEGVGALIDVDDEADDDDDEEEESEEDEE